MSQSALLPQLLRQRAQLADQPEPLQVIDRVDGVAAALAGDRQEPLRLVVPDRPGRDAAAIGQLLETERLGALGLRGPV